MEVVLMNILGAVVTFLLAFVVGEYDYVEDKDQDGVTVRVYTPKGKAVQGQFALEVRNFFEVVDIQSFSKRLSR